MSDEILTVLEVATLRRVTDKPVYKICRTNRTYGNKRTHGLIVDYLGVFDDVAKAVEFDEKVFRSLRIHAPAAAGGLR